jgi:hypothetical protein
MALNTILNVAHWTYGKEGKCPAVGPNSGGKVRCASLRNSGVPSLAVELVRNFSTGAGDSESYVRQRREPDTPPTNIRGRILHSWTMSKSIVL